MKSTINLQIFQFYELAKICALKSVYVVLLRSFRHVQSCKNLGSPNMVSNKMTFSCFSFHTVNKCSFPGSHYKRFPLCFVLGFTNILEEIFCGYKYHGSSSTFYPSSLIPIYGSCLLITVYFPPFLYIY